MAIPSIAMIPSGYKASKLYSVLPTDGGGDLDVVRATTATRVNSDGLIENVLSNVPRLDYSDGGCPSLLVEPQRTNLLLRSEEFDNAYWVKQASTISSNAVISPDGNLTMDKLVSDVFGVNPRIQKEITFLDNTDYTFSIYVKPSEWRYVVLTFRDKNVSNDRNAWFNMSTGLFETVNGILTARVLDSFFDGSYRISITINSLTGVAAPVVRAVATNSDNTFTIGDGTSGIYIWGAQLEVGSNATSYIPTVASTVTRNADVISKTGISDLINSVEGVLFVEIAAFSNDLATRIISLSDGTTTNRLYIGYNNASNQFIVVSQNPSSTNALVSSVSDITSFNKLAFKYKENDFALFINGLKVATDVSGTTFSLGTLNKLSFDSGAGGSPFYGNLKNLQVYKTALTDLELQTLTTL